MMVFIAIIASIFILSVVFFIHEFGHYLAAKLSGVPVLDFGLGFPPAIVKWKRNNTVYSLNAIPFGAFVRVLGMEDLKEKSPNSYWHQSVFKRFMIAFGGPLSNLICAWLILTISLWVFLAIPAKNFVLVEDVIKGSAAEQANLKQGDLIIKADGQTIEKSQTLTDFTKLHQGQVVKITVRRFGRDTEKEIQLGQGEAPLGIAMVDAAAGEKVPVLKAPLVSAVIIGQSIYLTAAYLGKAIVSVFTRTKVPFEVGGPVAVYGYVSQFTAMGYFYLIRLAAFISLALGFFNLLPLPALDGGRLTFLILEKIFGKKVVRPEVENTIHSVGFIALICLMILITYNDIAHLIKR